MTETETEKETENFSSLCLLALFLPSLLSQILLIVIVVINWQRFFQNSLSLSREKKVLMQSSLVKLHSLIG